MTKTAEKMLNPQEVRAYLLDNPDFFLENPDLFTQINFPHETSGAISLIERQVQVLRENFQGSLLQMADLKSNANLNHELLKKMQLLILELLKAGDASSLLTAFDRVMRKEFKLDQIQILMPDSASVSNLPFAQYLEADKLEKMRTDIFNLHIYVGRIPTKLGQYFSPASLENCKSVALTKLDFKDEPLYLLLGSQDESRFQSDMATDFIEFVGHALSILLTHSPGQPK